jgi:hypothetical protein
MLAIAMMAAAAAGLALGLRFGVVTFALLILAIAIICTAGIWGGSSRLVIAFQLLVTLGFVQISYLVGSLLTAHLPARAKTRRDRVQVRPGYQRAR